MKLLSWNIIVTLSLLIIISHWGTETEISATVTDNYPDIYINKLNMVILNQHGLPKNKLYARYLARYPITNKIELSDPKLEIFHPHNPNTIITAKKGWLLDDNSILHLEEDTQLIHTVNNETLEVSSPDIHLWLDKSYIETDKTVTIAGSRIIMKSNGINGYLNEKKLRLLSNVYTKILP